jgi:thiamine monophosphate kinase
LAVPASDMAATSAAPASFVILCCIASPWYQVWMERFFGVAVPLPFF